MRRRVVIALGEKIGASLGSFEPNAEGIRSQLKASIVVSPQDLIAR
jgi:hypothetical protein